MAGQAQAGQTSQGLFAPGREPNSRSGAVTTSTVAIQVAAQIGGLLALRPGDGQLHSVRGSLARRGTPVRVCVDRLWGLDIPRPGACAQSAPGRRGGQMVNAGTW
jgi:hypothetical protein